MVKPTAVLLIAMGLLCSMVGCAVYPDRPHSIKTSTSAEQFERLYWKAVHKGDWQQVVALQGPSVLFTSRSGDRLTGEQWLEQLKQNPPAEYLIRELQVTPQGADMVVSYSASVTQQKSQAPAELAVVSVWQHVRGSLILVAHSETPHAGAAK
ncbi:MAG TPA: nuclear transport factor 2 family protein [Acidisarcina sp.]|nr:nuclear transport factor 2 family protein [Acidisarcina sp.]